MKWHSFRMIILKDVHHPRLLRESIKQYAGSQYAPLLTRISFEVRSSHLEGQILTKNHQYEQIHVENFQGRNFLRKKSPCGMLHSKAKGFYHLFRSSQYAGLLQIPFNLKRYAVRSQNPNNKNIPFDWLGEYCAYFRGLFVPYVFGIFLGGYF